MSCCVISAACNSKHVFNIITGDETRIYAYEPEAKQKSTVWLVQDESHPAKAVRNTSKQMVASA